MMQKCSNPYSGWWLLSQYLVTHLCGSPDSCGSSGLRMYSSWMSATQYPAAAVLFHGWAPVCSPVTVCIWLLTSWISSTHSISSGSGSVTCAARVHGGPTIGSTWNSKIITNTINRASLKDSWSNPASLAPQAGNLSMWSFCSLKHSPPVAPLLAWLSCDKYEGIFIRVSYCCEGIGERCK